MPFNNIRFIKPNRELNVSYTGTNYAPMFRKKFNLDCEASNAKLYVCGLGIAYYYINGVKVTEDLFISPISDYRKTLWYNVYDVSGLLHCGENIIAVWCGNGSYNEEYKTAWDYDKADWRDIPKVIIDLQVNGSTALKTDESWKCLPETAITFNGLRSGEVIDFRMYSDKWNALDYDDSQWEMAVIDNTPPKGQFRECLCEPIRACEKFTPVKVTKTGDEKYLFDFGQNFSGYSHVKVKGSDGKEIVLRHAETINADNSLQLNTMQNYYKETGFQTTKLILSGNKDDYTPLFYYYGFRYVEVEGIENIEDFEIEGIYIHQDIKQKTTFECSDEFLTKLFRAGQFSTYSNMFYILTDCPTREKLGWTNDAQSSLEQILTNFDAEKFFTKWLQDIYDAMREDGNLPGIIPTYGWGFDWGNGPVSDGILFEIPYRVYLHSGNKKLLIDSLQYFDRYFKYIYTKTDDNGYINVGLDDWARPDIWSAKDTNVVPVQLINSFLMIRFNEIAALAADLSGADKKKYEEQIQLWKDKIIKDFTNEDGTCKSNKQTAVSMMIYYGVYDNLEPLKEQLKKLVEEADFHHDCGMVGMRRLLCALNICGLEEYAFKILVSHGHPSYHEWFEFDDATSLWELWNPNAREDSKNHHMYSDYMSWIIKTIVGVTTTVSDECGEIIHVDPYIFNDLSYVKGSYITDSGEVGVSWERKEDKTQLTVDVNCKNEVYYKDQKLAFGKTTICL